MLLIYSSDRNFHLLSIDFRCIFPISIFVCHKRKSYSFEMTSNDRIKLVVIKLFVVLKYEYYMIILA